MLKEGGKREECQTRGRRVERLSSSEEGKDERGDDSEGREELLEFEICCTSRKILNEKASHQLRQEGRRK